jgi:hypothetical protein
MRHRPRRVGRRGGADGDVEIAFADARRQFVTRSRLQPKGALAHGFGQPRSECRRHLVLEILDDAERQRRQVRQVERVEIPVSRAQAVERVDVRVRNTRPAGVSVIGPP